MDKGSKTVRIGLSFILFSVLTLNSCKKVEVKFPKGIYVLSIEGSYPLHGEEHDIGETSCEIRLISANNTQFKLQQFIYPGVINPDETLDTLHAPVSTLKVTNNRSVSGIIHTVEQFNNDSYTLTSGRISKHAKNDYRINGNIDFTATIIDEGEFETVAIDGTFLFKQK